MNIEGNLLGEALKVKSWPKDIIAAGRRHTVGLKSDGTVVAVGDNEYGQCDVSGWRGIRLSGK
ncbi:Regulator of Chromosome Condensation (RCC1) repeat protein [Cohnella lupini]|uniref:Regulator of Chromosome Condensation (RCC1) repeat protein n=1 Tax=Cohnella lupini TaxID=1294267 RepID=A0A3D9HV98_9BACL|nr:Regulator of Chromosome Condensation (RCC1) repeat protein [Cohnella lupini]